MSEFKVSSRYAKALLDLSIEQGVLDRVRDEVAEFIAIIKSHKELQSVLKNPIIKQDKKINILTALFGEKFNPVLIGFFKIMVNKGRGEILYATAQEFIQQYNAYKGIVIAKVSSAAPLSAENATQLKQLIASSIGKEVIIESSVNADLIGGFVVTVGDRQIDASLAGRLNKLDRAFHA
ncbi:ATP synthase F1 subunit delta [Olivibacter sp. XZL3]|uniref:ATP synthase F1 subunit delta n=1 Tax=Olivibacter sp. XZL3 TaxID=1735116 RepID=UPI0010663298|nr:ATP synthase F1 subunit delta [Olivibacter sp. XZL3]